VLLLVYIILFPIHLQVLGSALWLMYFMAEGTPGQKIEKLIIDSGVAPQLVSNLTHSHLYVKTGAILVVAQIVSGNGGEIIEQVLDSGLLKQLHAIFASKNPCDYVCEVGLNSLKTFISISPTSNHIR